MKQKGLYLVISCVAIAALSLYLCVDAFFWLRQESVRIRKKRDDLASLKAMASRMSEWEGALKSAENNVTAGVTDISGLLQEMFPGLDSEATTDRSKSLRLGWTLREIEISLRDVPFEIAFDFVKKVELPEYGWRLSGCTLKTAYGAVGAGDAIIRIEKLQREWSHDETGKKAK